jgi:hypothetical protein
VYEIKDTADSNPLLFNLERGGEEDKQTSEEMLSKFTFKSLLLEFIQEITRLGNLKITHWIDVF